MQKTLDDQSSDEHKLDVAGAMVVAEAVSGPHDGCASHPGPEDNLRVPGQAVMKGNTKVGVVADDRKT
eukprot:489873-Prorocentrum_lima.AAC.1